MNDNDKYVVSQNGRKVKRVFAELIFADRLGGCKARWGVGRMRYIVEPGLYAVGEPDAESPVLVSANYKMSFDRLRKELGEINAWILVLDTKGINVWCAAGKGTFGTEELVRRIEAVELDKVVNHRKLIVPQLGATGVSAHKVKQLSGFRVVYGPVRAEDLPAFLVAGMKATEEMRQVLFPMRDRVVLIPMELVMGAKYALITAVCLLLLGGLGRGGYSLDSIMTKGLPSALLLFGACLAGVVLGPVLLPWLPGRAFSVKGLCAGLAVVLGFGLFAQPLPGGFGNFFTVTAWVLAVPAVISFLVMNFTGASTYTSLSGVRREMRIAVPLQAVAAVLGLGLWIAGLFL